MNRLEISRLFVTSFPHENHERCAQLLGLGNSTFTSSRLSLLHIFKRSRSVPVLPSQECYIYTQHAPQQTPVFLCRLFRRIAICKMAEQKWTKINWIIPENQYLEIDG